MSGILVRKYCMHERFWICDLTIFYKSPAYTDAGKPNDDGTFNTIICIDDIAHVKYKSVADIPTTKSNCGMNWPSRMEDVLGKCQIIL